MRVCPTAGQLAAEWARFATSCWMSAEHDLLAAVVGLDAGGDPVPHEGGGRDAGCGGASADSVHQ